MNKFFTPELDAQFAYSAYWVGQEKSPLLVIDNFLKDPQQLVDFCAKATTLEQIDTYYPGIRVAAPDIYLQALFHYLGPLLAEVFALSLDAIQGGRALYSLVTTPPEQLEPKQCLPHVDSFTPGELACVHYLCTPEQGGTSFYRHKSTGYETLSNHRIEAYNQSLVDQGAVAKEPKSYMNGANAFFDRIAKIDALFNRIIIYPTNLLHSANISSKFQFSPHPREGRLTLNSFIYKKR